MSYQITQVDPLNRSSWFTPQQCKDYYKIPYQFRELQIHWWNDPSTRPTHEGTVEYIRNKTGGSVNYVVSAGKITRMVPEENCALTTQGGNPYGIKLECSPYGTDEDYKTIGWLIADIQKRRGKLPLVPHKKYWNTDCPGTLDLTRMQEEANKYLKGDEMTYPNKDDIKNLWQAVRRPAPNANDFAYWTNGTGNPNWNKGADEVWKALSYELTNHVNTIVLPTLEKQVQELEKAISPNTVEILKVIEPLKELL